MIRPPCTKHRNTTWHRKKMANSVVQTGYQWVARLFQGPLPLLRCTYMDLRHSLGRPVYYTRCTGWSDTCMLHDSHMQKTARTCSKHRAHSDEMSLAHPMVLQWHMQGRGGTHIRRHSNARLLDMCLSRCMVPCMLKC